MRGEEGDRKRPCCDEPQSLHTTRTRGTLPRRADITMLIGFVSLTTHACLQLHMLC